MHKLSIGKGYFVNVFKHKNRYAFCIAEFVTASICKSKGKQMDDVIYRNNISQLLIGSLKSNYIEKYGTLKINYDNGGRVKNCLYVDDLVDFLSDPNIYVVQHYRDSLETLKESLDSHIEKKEPQEDLGVQEIEEPTREVISFDKGIKLIVQNMVKEEVSQIKDDITSLSCAINDQAGKLKKVKNVYDTNLLQENKYKNLYFRELKNIQERLLYLEKELGIKNHLNRVIEKGDVSIEFNFQKDKVFDELKRSHPDTHHVLKNARISIDNNKDNHKVFDICFILPRNPFFIKESKDPKHLQRMVPIIEKFMNKSYLTFIKMFHLRVSND